MADWNIITTLNNRELAGLVWFVILLIVVLSSNDLRVSFLGLLKILFHYKILVILTVHIGFISMLTIGMAKIHLWNIGFLKETLLYYMGTLAILYSGLSKIQKVKDRKKFYKDLFSEQIRVIVLINMLLNVYVFHFWIEFLLVPIIFLLVGGISLYKNVKEYHSSIKVFQFLIMCIGLWVVGFSILQFINYSNIETFVRILQEFFIGLILNVAMILFMYGLNKYTIWDQNHIRKKRGY